MMLFFAQNFFLNLFQYKLYNIYVVNNLWSTYTDKKNISTFDNNLTVFFFSRNMLHEQSSKKCTAMSK